MVGSARRKLKWAITLLPIFLRALVPIGFMPMAGPGFTLQLMVCDGYAPVAWTAAMPADMPMNMSMDMGIGSSDSHGGAPVHDEHGNCPYGSAPALGALPTFANLHVQLLQRSIASSLATAQLDFFEVLPRAQTPRGPPA